MHDRTIVEGLAERFGLQTLLILGEEAGSMTVGDATFERLQSLPDRPGAERDAAAPMALFRSGARFDLVWIPRSEQYEAAMRDLVCGLHLLTPRGTLILRGCLAPAAGGANAATPEAFVDFAFTRKGISYITLDRDDGYGMLAPNYRFNPFFTDIVAPSLELDWFLAGRSGHADLLRTHGASLLRVVGWDRFQEIMDDFETFSS